MSGIDTERSGYYDRNTVLLCEVEFHVKTLWSTKRPESSTCCLTRLAVSYIVSSLATCCVNQNRSVTFTLTPIVYFQFLIMPHEKINVKALQLIIKMFPHSFIMVETCVHISSVDCFIMSIY